MTFLRLQPHVTYGLVSKRPIFLDLRRDRYVALDPLAGSAFSRLGENGGGTAAADEAVILHLLASGLFEESESTGSIEPVTAHIPEESALSLGSGASKRGLRDVAEVWLAVARVRRHLKLRRLNLLIESHRARRHARERSRSARDVEELAGRFAAARRLVPIEQTCLQDSLALAIWLARRSAFPDIVFGVKLNPFAAHCWVQTNQFVLNDAADTVAQFVPVLVV